MNSESRGNALVTGGARRIGRAIAEALARAGWTVGIHCHRSTDAAEALRAELDGAGLRSYVVTADLTDDDAVEGLMARAAEAAGPVTCLVNNASLFEKDDVRTATRQGWRAHLETNLTAPFFLCQRMAADLPAGSRGDIVNIIDQRAVNLQPGFVSYTVSKSALWALTRSLALDLAPDVRVNAIGPGPTLPSPRQTEEQFARQAGRVPLGRGAPPAEIADGVLYILSASAMTGQMIALDGGQHLGWDTPGPDAAAIEE